jgi:hypothetical protein
MTEASYIEQGNFADYYRMLCTHHSVIFEKTLSDLSRWLDTGQITLDPPLERPYELCPRTFARLAIRTNGRLRDAAEFRVLVPVVEHSTIEIYPPPRMPPIFKELIAEPDPVAEWTERLARIMNPDGELNPKERVTQSDYWVEAGPEMQAAGITRAVYRKTIWVKAREKAGLPPETKRGPKRQ